MVGLSSLNPLNQRSSHSKYTTLPLHERDVTAEKDGHSDRDSFDADNESDYSCPSSPITSSSRETTMSHASNRPMLARGRKPSTGSQRRSARPPSSSWRIPQRKIRYVCFALMAAIILFIFGLVRMSIVSARRVEMGDVGERPPPPPAPWESFWFLSRYYGGVRKLVPLSKNIPEYPRLQDEPMPNTTATISARDFPLSSPFKPYPDYSSKEYLDQYMPVEECFLDAEKSVRIPQLQYFNGRPEGFPDNVMGSYEVLNLPEDICFERYGRLGPYGHGYGLRSGGMGTGQNGDMEGAERVWEKTPEVDYHKVDWGAAQQRCHAANAARFKDGPKRQKAIKDVHVETTAEAKSAVQEFDKVTRAEESSVLTAGESSETTKSTTGKQLLPRSAVVIRTWDEFLYREEDIMYLRSLMSELALGSGGEYDVHLLVQVKDDRIPVWADEETYERHLKERVPEEFWGIATLWSETQMLMLYQGLHDEFARGPDLPVHGVYRGLLMALQHFAHTHPEYEFFWHWEMDIRYTGHFYDLLKKFTSFAKEQPRKLLWERNSRFYIPSVHGSWDDFKHMVRVQTEMGVDSPSNVWAGIKGSKAPDPLDKAATVDKPIWGPQRPFNQDDWFEIENDPEPPTSYERDKYEWGVGEEADLITLNPIFDPQDTTWGLAHDVTGYNVADGLPPRRAAIITAGRLSRRLLETMHRETAFKKHHAFPEMWPAMSAFAHGYKAVYVPHPMFVDREWPTAYLASVMNGGKNGATGGARTSVFGDREHNLRGMTWYYNAGFPPNLYRRWLGFKVSNDGGELFETQGMKPQDVEGKLGPSSMMGGEGRMCLPPMLIHPVKDVELPVQGLKEEEVVSGSDPDA